jgi:hypothetical protein
MKWVLDAFRGFPLSECRSVAASPDYVEYICSGLILGQVAFFVACSPNEVQNDSRGSLDSEWKCKQACLFLRPRVIVRSQHSLTLVYIDRDVSLHANTVVQYAFNNAQDIFPSPLRPFIYRLSTFNQRSRSPASPHNTIGIAARLTWGGF